MLDEEEFLSPFGLRSVSRLHAEHPYVLRNNGREYSVSYVPGEGDTALFGGNSNWRGPIWFPVNYLIIEALERYHHYYGDSFVVECPTGSGRMMDLKQVAEEITRRQAGVFLPDASGSRPCHGADSRYAVDPNFKDLVLFYEYFHGDIGRGIGASHQTGWTALAARYVERTVKARDARLRSAEGPSRACYAFPDELTEARGGSLHGSAGSGADRQPAGG